MKGKREIKKIKRKFRLEMFCCEHFNFVIAIGTVALTFILWLLLQILSFTAVADISRSNSNYYSGKVIEIPLLEIKECAVNFCKIENVVYEAEETVQEETVLPYDEETIEVLCKVVYGESRGCDKTQQAAVIWCILNRMDSDKFPNDVVAVVTQKNQFEGYSSKFPVTDEIKELVLDVLGRYEQEKAGTENVGRVLPNDYLFFHSAGNGTNLFRQNYKSKTIWDWSWGTPYGD